MNTSCVSELDLITHETVYGRVDSNHTIDVDIEKHFSQEILINYGWVSNNLREYTIPALIAEWCALQTKASKRDRDWCVFADCVSELPEIKQDLEEAEELFFELSQFLACSIRLDMGYPKLGAADATEFIQRKHDKGVFCEVVGGILMTAQIDDKGRTVFGFCDLHDCQLRGGIVFVDENGNLEECINTDLSDSRYIKGHEDFRFPDRAWIAKSRRAIK